METLAEDMEDRTTVITDIRYDDYPSDEVDWLKNELDGILVHISQWHWDYPDAVKTYIAPANTEEERNDPKVKAKADYLFEAQKVSGTQEEVKDSLRPKVKEFIKWMSSA